MTWCLRKRWSCDMALNFLDLWALIQYKYIFIHTRWPAKACEMMWLPNPFFSSMLQLTNSMLNSVNTECSFNVVGGVKFGGGWWCACDQPVHCHSPTPCCPHGPPSPTWLRLVSALSIVVCLLVNSSNPYLTLSRLNLTTSCREKSNL